MRRRVQDLRVPSASYVHSMASGHRLDLSHNESARMAVDSLLSRGLQEYHQVLSKEGEVDFLSQPEKIYIMENGRDGDTGFSSSLVFVNWKEVNCLQLISGYFIFFMQLMILPLMTSLTALLSIPSLVHIVLHCPLTVILLSVWI